MPGPRAMNNGLVSRCGDADQRAAVSHSEESQAGCARCRSRQVDHVVSALDSRLAAQAADDVADGADRTDRVGIVAPTGYPGSVLMFHGHCVHASPPNITPCPRKIVYLTLCAVSNHITKFARSEWIAHRDFTPIKSVGDDALYEHACAHRVAAE